MHWFVEWCKNNLIRTIEHQAYQNNAKQTWSRERLSLLEEVVKQQLSRLKSFHGDNWEQFYMVGLLSLPYQPL